jgi:hypothetical protein
MRLRLLSARCGVWRLLLRPGGWSLRLAPLLLALLAVVFGFLCSGRLGGLRDLDASPLLSPRQG